MGGEREGENVGDCEEKPCLHELCRGAFEPLRTAIRSDLMLLPGCRLLYDDGGSMSGNMNREAVLEHIILDMTGSPAADANNVSLQRTLRRTKRLLTRNNSVLLFRLVIMVLVACMLIFTTLLTWYFTRTFSARSIKNLSFALRRQILHSGLNSIAFVLNQAYGLSVSLSLMHEQTFLALHNSTWDIAENELRDVNWRFFQSERHLRSVAFLNQDGLLADFTREDHSDDLYFTNSSPVGTNTSWYSQIVMGSLHGYSLKQPSRILDGPYQNQFLVDLLRQRAVRTWSMDTGRPQKQFVSSAVPVVNLQTKQFLGMSIVTTTFKDVHHYLSTIDLLGGYLYFFRLNASGDSTLVAASYSHPNDIYMEPRKALNVYVSEAATYLQSVYGYHVLLQNETHSEDVSLNGRQFYIDTMPLENQFKLLNLTAVILVPRTSIMGEMDARSKTVIKVSVGAALGVLVIGFTLICFLTRRMSTEMQLRQELIRQLVAKHKAEQSSNYKTQFLANMSHEMRTPMAGIIGLLDLLACDTLTPDQEMSVAQIRRCATGLLALVNNVLDISKVEAGKMELEVIPFNVIEELESLVDMFAAQCLGSEVDITLDLSDDMPSVVKGDVARIRQIFTNLLSNSVKFTENGHIIVRGWTDQSLLATSRKSIGQSFQETGDGMSVLGIRRSRSSMGSESHRESGKIALSFEIDDTGCGIPATLQETVFDRFVQADSSTTRSHGGSGLGLYIVRSLVKMMGGDVQIAPKPGPGTRMRFHMVLEKVSLHDSSKVGFYSAKSPITFLEDSLSAFVGYPPKEVEQEMLPTPELLTQTHALVALPESVTKSVAVCWLQRRGLSVTCVNKWEDILPTLNQLCRSSLTESNSSSLNASNNTKDAIFPGESPATPFALAKAESSSGVSEIFLDQSRHPVLALLDVALAPCDLLAACNLSLKGSKGIVKSVSCVEQKISGDMELLVSALQEVQAKNDVLVAWVTPPNSDPLLKQALQSLPYSVVLKKPLHCSRMARLLHLLAGLGKPDRVETQALSHTSSDPSTPRLTGVSSPLRKVERAYNVLYPESADLEHDISAADEHSMHKQRIAFAPPDKCLSEKHKGNRSFPLQVIREDRASTIAITTSHQSSFREQLLPNFPGQDGIGSQDSPSTPESPTSELISPESLTSGLITPESPTSGLITPEGANSIADGVQDCKKDTMFAKALENEWKGPVIDLKLPSKGKGTSWHVRAPVPGTDHSSLVVSVSESPSTTEPSSPPGSNRIDGLGSGVLAGISILLVEDTPVLQRLASMMLKKLGAEVTVVGDGLQAVEAVAQAGKPTTDTEHTICAEVTGQKMSSAKKFDLILMDCAMPVMDGYGATKAIREAEIHTGRHIPIVALTAHALASDEEKCLAVGMDAYLTKPINCKQLVSTVQKLVSKDTHQL